MASTKALVQAGVKRGGKLFVSVEELAQALGMSLHHVEGVKNLTVLANELRSVGARMGAARRVGNMDEALRMLPRNGSVLLIDVQMVKAGQILVRHTMYLFYDFFGRVRIMDRKGIFTQLSEVATRYRIDHVILRDAILLENVYAKLMGPKGTAMLAMEVLGVVATEKK